MTNFFDDFPSLCAAGDVGLIGDDQQQESEIAELRQCLGNARKDLDLVETLGRMWNAVADERANENAVTVEENSALKITERRYSRWFSRPACRARLDALCKQSG